MFFRLFIIVKFKVDMLGVGADIFSYSSLFKRDWYKEVNDCFLRKSKYNKEHLLSGKHNYIGYILSTYK